MNTFFPEGVIGSWFSNVVNQIFPNRGLRRFFTAQYMLGTKGAIWIDRQNLWLVYSEHPHLNNTINKGAELLSLGKLRLRDISNQKEIFKHEALTLMRKPNPLQSYSEWVTQYKVFKDVYGNAVFYQNKKIFGDVPAALWNLPPWTIKINPTGKIFDQVSVDGIIESYTMLLAGESRTFKTSEIILKNDNIDSEYLKSQSKIIALIKPLSNIEAALRTANVLIGDHGAYGIISANNKDSMGGAIPFAGKEKDKVEDAIKLQYGNKPGQKQMIVSGVSLTYTPIGSPLSEMQLGPEVEQNFGIILDAYGIDRDVFASTKGATNENKLIGIKSTLQNTIQPEADDLCQTLNDAFGLTDQGLELFISFDHLPVMQEDALSTSKGYLAKIQALDIMKKSGIISPAQYAQEAEVKFDGTGESEITVLSVDPNKPKNENENEGQV